MTALQVIKPHSKITIDTVLASRDRADSAEDAEDVRIDTREFCVLKITAAGWHSGALVLPINDYLCAGTSLKKDGDRKLFPAIGGSSNTDEQNTFGPTGDSENQREFDPSTLRLPRTGHRGISGISSVARGMRGGLRGRGGLSASGVVRSGADEGMRRRTLNRGAADGEHPTEQERQFGEETAEAGERLGESIRAARGRNSE